MNVSVLIEKPQPMYFPEGVRSEEETVVVLLMWRCDLDFCDESQEDALSRTALKKLRWIDPLLLKIRSILSFINEDSLSSKSV